jgi:hypothetical protein
LPPGRVKMGAVLEPVTVWMVHLERGGDLQDEKGTLRMEEDALVFASKRSEAVTRFPFSATRGAKRVLGSPVLVVRWRDGDVRRETAFYFAQPPPLRRADTPMTERQALRTQRPSLFGMARGQSRRAQRKDAIRYLTARSADSRDSIGPWAKAITERARGA